MVWDTSWKVRPSQTVSQVCLQSDVRPELGCVYIPIRRAAGLRVCDYYFYCILHAFCTNRQDEHRITRDPFRGGTTESQTMNPYSYVSDGPMTVIAPPGMSGYSVVNYKRMCSCPTDFWGNLTCKITPSTMPVVGGIVGAKSHSASTPHHM